MSLKNWKQSNSTTWENEKENKKIHISEVFSYNTQKFSYRVLVNSLSPYQRRILEREFKTREQANKFVNSYRRSH